MCLAFDIEEAVQRRIPCCSKANGCDDFEAARRKCPMYSQHDRRRRASDAVHDMLGGEYMQIDRLMLILHLTLVFTHALST